MSPLLEVQRPCAGIGSGDTPDFAQLIICGTVIPPPSSQEVPVHAAGWMGLPELTTHGRGLELRSQLFRPQGCACAGPYLEVASAPRASSREGQ